MSLLALAGLSAGLGVLGSTIASAGASANVGKARKEERDSYRRARGFLDSEYYRDPLSTVGNRALLKSLDERVRDNREAVENQIAAGGGTMENRLAAMQAGNNAVGSVYTNLLQSEDARRQNINNQKLQLDMQHSSNIQNSYLQNAQNWQAWGAQMGNAGMQFGSSMLLGDSMGLKLKDIIG